MGSTAPSFRKNCTRLKMSFFSRSSWEYHVISYSVKVLLTSPSKKQNFKDGNKIIMSMRPKVYQHLLDNLTDRWPTNSQTNRPWTPIGIRVHGPTDRPTADSPIYTTVNGQEDRRTTGPCGALGQTFSWGLFWWTLLFSTKLRPSTDMLSWLRVNIKTTYQSFEVAE